MAYNRINIFLSYASVFAHNVSWFPSSTKSTSRKWVKKKINVKENNTALAAATAQNDCNIKYSNLAMCMNQIMLEYNNLVNDIKLFIHLLKL